MSKKDEILR